MAKVDCKEWSNDSVEGLVSHETEVHRSYKPKQTRFSERRKGNSKGEKSVQSRDKLA